MSYQLAIGINLFASPEDDTLAEFESLLLGATKSIHLADYSFNIMAVVNTLIAKAEAGLDVTLVLDNSQSKGKTEVPEITQLKTCDKIKLVIVESSKNRIMHDKFTTIDGHLTQTGSWNYTTTASDENNNYFVFDDSLIANDFSVTAAFDKVFMDMFTGVTTKIKYSQGV